MSALRAVFQAHGLPIALYTDRAGWVLLAPSAGGKVDLQPAPRNSAAPSRASGSSTSATPSSPRPQRAGQTKRPFHGQRQNG